MTRKNRNALLVVLTLFLAAYAGLATTYFVATRNFAIAEADKLIEDILLTHRALHGYIEEVQKPELYRLQEEGKLYKEYFSAKLLSSTYVARGMADYLNRERAKRELPEVYFKLASNNPFNPLNRADEKEARYLEAMNAGTLKKVHEVQDIGGKTYLFVALPTERTKASCMRCHSNPADAPKELIAVYGTESGFYEQEQSIRAMISIRVPLDQWLQEARQRAAMLSGITLAAMALVFAAIAYFIVRMDRAQAGLMVSEAKLRQTNDELNGTIGKLRETQVQLIQAEKMASIGHLAAGVAHEINNPAGFVSSNLTTLSKYVQSLDSLLRRYQEAVARAGAGRPLPPQDLADLQAMAEDIDIDFLREDIGQLLTESADGIARIRKIVADLRDFSDVDRTDALVDADVNEIIDKAVSVAWADLKAKAELTKDYAALPAVRCRPGQLGQVFLNLLVNAAQAIDGRGTIAVRTEAKDGYVLATVSDSGCGIAPEIVGKIFDPFFTTRDVGQGTGLGLNVAYNIVRSLGGTLTVASTPGAGSVFAVRLPTVE